LKFGAVFPQFKRKESFEGFGVEKQLPPILEKMYNEKCLVWRANSDIKMISPSSLSTARGRGRFSSPLFSCLTGTFLGKTIVYLHEFIDTRKNNDLL